MYVAPPPSTSVVDLDDAQAARQRHAPRAQRRQGRRHAPRPPHLRRLRRALRHGGGDVRLDRRRLPRRRRPPRARRGDRRRARRRVPAGGTRNRKIANAAKATTLFTPRGDLHSLARHVRDGRHSVRCAHPLLDDGRMRPRGARSMPSPDHMASARTVRLLSLPGVLEVIKIGGRPDGKSLAILARGRTPAAARRVANNTDVLDVGCGTGVAGIAAAVVCSPRRVVLATGGRPAGREERTAAGRRRLRHRRRGVVGAGDPHRPARRVWPRHRVRVPALPLTRCAASKSTARDSTAGARALSTLDWCVAPRGSR